MTAFAFAVAAADLGVNGPKDEPLDWNAVDWRTVEGGVRRLRQRIFKASQAGDLKQVRNLQKLMLRSRANTLVSVRQVTTLLAITDGRVGSCGQGKFEAGEVAGSSSVQG
jgi:RNA-directed DNA polymerase